MTTEKIVHIGRVELTEDEAFQIYQEGKYIVTYSKVYQLFYSKNTGVYGQEIFHRAGMAKRGRFHAMTGADVNWLLGFKLVNEEVAYA